MGRIKCTVEAGALIRKEFEATVRSFCNKHDIELQMEEVRGFLSSDFIIRAEGTDSAMLGLKRVMDRML